MGHLRTDEFRKDTVRIALTSGIPRRQVSNNCHVAVGGGTVTSSSSDSTETSCPDSVVANIVGWFHNGDPVQTGLPGCKVKRSSNAKLSNFDFTSGSASPATATGSTYTTTISEAYCDVNNDGGDGDNFSSLGAFGAISTMNGNATCQVKAANHADQLACLTFDNFDNDVAEVYAVVKNIVNVGPGPNDTKELKAFTCSGLGVEINGQNSK